MSFESTLLVKNECLVYRIPPKTTVRGYRAADWGLDKPSWTGKMRITANGKNVSIKVGVLEGLIIIFLIFVFCLFRAQKDVALGEKTIQTSYP